MTTAEESFRWEEGSEIFHLQELEEVDSSLALGVRLAPAPLGGSSLQGML